MHAADLSGQGMGKIWPSLLCAKLNTNYIGGCDDVGESLAVAVKWENKISEEFRRQAEKEIAMGLPVASFMENLDDEKSRANLQIQFIDFVLEPMWKETSRCSDLFVDG